MIDAPIVRLYKGEFRETRPGDDDLGDPGDATFAYDHEGTRVRRSVNVDTDEDCITDAQDETHFLQDKNNHTGYSQVLEEKSSLTAAPDRSYLIGHDIIAQAVAGTVQHLLYDAGGGGRLGRARTERR
jgi:hypothetical protein